MCVCVISRKLSQNFNSILTQIIAEKMIKLCLYRLMKIFEKKVRKEYETLLSTASFSMR